MRTSSTDPRSPVLRRGAVVRLAAASVIAALALGVAALTDIGTTGALYSASTTATIDGFQARTACEDPGFTSAPKLVAGLGPTLHWGFAPGTSPWTEAEGSPASSEPDGAVLCDEGVLELTTGQSVSTTLTDPATGSVLLVLGTPSAAGTALTLADPAGAALDVRVTGTTASIHTWDAGTPSTELATVALDAAAGAHLIAISFDGAEVTLWADGESATVVLPAVVDGPLLGLGALAAASPAGELLTTATFAASELAVVPASVPPATLAEIFAAAQLP